MGSLSRDSIEPGAFAQLVKAAQLRKLAETSIRTGPSQLPPTLPKIPLAGFRPSKAMSNAGAREHGVRPGSLTVGRAGLLSDRSPFAPASEQERRGIRRRLAFALRAVPARQGGRFRGELEQWKEA